MTNNLVASFFILVGSWLLSSSSFAVGAKPSDSEFKDASAQCQTHFDRYVKMGYSLRSLAVPEDWQNPSGKKIRLAYYIKNDFQKKNVVIFFNGGPASSADSSLSNLKMLSDKHPIDFVIFVQRGTGCSSAFPNKDEEIALYTSSSIVNDAEALRKVIMGNQKWKIFGQSYGGLIVQRYMERHPEGVSHAYAHGYSQMQDPNEWMALRLKKQSEVSLRRIKAYDDNNKNQNLQKKIQSFPESACVENEGRKFCGRELVDTMFLYLGFQTVPFAQILDGFSVQATHSPEWQNWVYDSLIKPFFETDRAGSIISVVDMAGSADIDICKGAELTKTYIDNNLGKGLINECRFQKALAKYLNPAPLPSSIHGDLLRYEIMKANIEKNRIKYFLYSSYEDSFVPPSVFAEQVATLGNAVHYTAFAKSGHEGFMSEIKIIGDLNLDSDYFWDGE